MSQLSNEIKSDFPIFEGSDLVYLDNAATTQKPQSVLDSINSSYTESNANVHRALYSLGAKATEKYEGARKKISAFIGANSSKEIIFTSGATESLNLLAYSLGNDINPGDEILISEMEHHSNIIPWQQLAKRTGSIIRYIPVTDDGELDLSQSDRLFNVKTKIVSITHISNVLGTINPIKKISSLANKCGAVLIIDGAQGAAHKKIDVKNLGCDFYAFSGHKMFGPTGVGVLYSREEILEKMRPYQTGGGIIETVTMTDSTWTSIPHRFEPGSPMAAQAIALAEAVNYLESCLEKHDNSLNEYSMEKMKSINGISIYGNAPERTPIISFNIEGIHSLDLAHFLDYEGITIRSGHHCCQPLMQALDITACARVSFYFYNSVEEVDFLVDKINKAVQVIK